MLVVGTEVPEPLTGPPTAPLPCVLLPAAGRFALLAIVLPIKSRPLLYYSSRRPVCQQYPSPDGNSATVQLQRAAHTHACMAAHTAQRCPIPSPGVVSALLPPKSLCKTVHRSVCLWLYSNPNCCAGAAGLERSTACRA